MIRLVALACGLLCGFGMLWSGLFEPSLMRSLWPLHEPWDPSIGVGLVAAYAAGAAVFALARSVSTPILGGEAESVDVPRGYTAMSGWLLIGMGWGLAGYFPLGAVVALGLFAPGAAVFLASILGGMIACDLFSGRFLSRGIRDIRG